MHTTTGALGGLRDRADEVGAAGHGGVDDHQVGGEERLVLPGGPHAAGLSDRFDLGQRLEAHREPTTVDRVGIDDEELHSIPASLS